VPFAFVFQPELLLNGTPAQIAFTLAVTVFGIVCLSAGVIGYLFAPLRMLQRALLVAAACFLVFAEEIYLIIGFSAGFGAFAWSFLESRSAGRATVQPTI
jgi:TRAP-type uncharacterized transport system fused permease subunit